MAKEKHKDKEERRKEKKEKKEKRSETNGVKKEKREKREKSKKLKREESPVASAVQEADVTTKLLNTLEQEKPGTVAVKADGEIEVKVKSEPLLAALVPFANPLADEKTEKKILKSVKKSAKVKCLKRGVKEVVKALRKTDNPSASSATSLPPAVIVIAADISPMDVISHLPVLCEDKGIPYVFVPSRVDLGAASATKRPTSVAMISKEKGKKAPEETVGWDDVYEKLVSMVQKAGRDVKI